MATKKQTAQKSEKVVNKVAGPDFKTVEVYVGYGMTLNIGNYESFRVDAGITLRADRPPRDEADRKEMENAMYEYGWNAVKEQLKPQVLMVRKKSGGKGGGGDEG